MKILFLCHYVPYPPDHGAKIRAYHFIRHLSQNNSVTVATLAHTEPELTQGMGLKDYCEEVIAEVLRPRVRWSQALSALGSRSPSSVAYFRSARLQDRIDQTLKSANFDRIVVFCAFMAQYVLEWQGGYRVLDFVDIDSAKWAEYSRHKAFPLSSGYALEAAKLRKYEYSISRHFHHCAVISQGEFEEFKRLGVPVPCTIVPNGVDTDYFHPNGNRQAESSSAIVFLGRMDYFPNIDAVLHFTQSVLPIIRAAVPDVEFRIIGSNPTPAIERLRQIPGVIVTGHVPDVRPFLTDAVVSVAPLRMARGTQNKILESMAMGIPVIATSEAAKGVDAIPEQHILIGNTPDAFARQVIRILKDRKVRADLSKVGRERVEQVHSWPHSTELLDAILNYSSGRSGDSYKH
jgi:sugar transferase (PEP-CTERM/EpsH1 system associated)